VGQVVNCPFCLIYNIIETVEEIFKSHKGPYNFVIRRLIKSAHINEYEEWLKKVSGQIKSFEGNVGLYVIKPMHIHHPEYVVIMQFDSQKHLTKFKNSEMRKEWLEYLETISLGHASQRSYSPLESYFSPHLKEGNSEVADVPSKYKMLIITLICAYPVILLCSLILNLLPITLSYPIKVLVTLASTMLITLYVSIPLITKLARKWLTS